MSEAGSTIAPAPSRRGPDRRRELLDQVEAARRHFVEMLHAIGGTEPGGRLASADLTLALRHVEDAEFRAKRHVKSQGRE